LDEDTFTAEEARPLGPSAARLLAVGSQKSARQAATGTKSSNAFFDQEVSFHTWTS
jgi:hypothetical protein